MTNQNQYPSGNLDFIDDARFLELTHGVGKDDIHTFMVAMRDFGSAGIKVEDETIALRPGNLENGSLIPELEVEGQGVRTRFMSFGGTKVSITVTQLSEDLKGLGPVEGEVLVGEGTQVQDETDFKLIPESHWKAIKLADESLKAQPAQEPQQVAKTKKRGGFIARLLSGGGSPYKH